ARGPGGRRGRFQAALIDVGCGGSLLADWLRSVGVQYLPVIVLTHNDDDHVRGLSQLVQRYRRHIGKVLFVVDRHAAEIPYYLDAQGWVRAGIIAASSRLETPQRARPGMGA